MFTPAIIDDIKLVQKAQMKYQTAFETIIEKVIREDEEKKAKQAKEAILHKQELEKRKAREAKRIEEKKRHDAENRARQEDERNATTEQVPGEPANRSGGAEASRTNQDIQASGHELEDTSTGDTRGSAQQAVIGSTWSEVSPEQASQYMERGTGVPASRWLTIIYHESTNNPTVTNSIGCFGFLQLHPVHGAVSQMTPQQYLDTAIGVYQSQGLAAWEVVTMGRA